MRRSGYENRGNNRERQGKQGVKKWNKRIAVGAALTILVACSPTHGLKPIPPVDGSYRLGAGDQIRVIAYNEPQLTNTFTVSDAGMIAFPLLGRVPTAGKTPGELAQEIGTDLSQQGLLHKPSISVEVTQYRPVFILGEVQKPGQYNYLPGMTMQTLAALAGGYTYRAITNTASVVRTEGTHDEHPVEGKIKPDSLLAPGDVVTVYERFF
ncbi:polysaccharide export protein [Acetobacter estunensis]|nr:polysaccharide export protein [Acetobacter estunensis]